MSIAVNNWSMDEYILKHLQDVLNAISDLESKSQLSYIIPLVKDYLFLS